MSLKTWWRRKSGLSKTVTILATALILQIGLCFASPGEPRWFDRLFGIQPRPDVYLRIGLVTSEAFLCLITFLLLLGAALAQITRSSTIDEDLPSIVPKPGFHYSTCDHDAGDSND